MQNDKINSPWPEPLSGSEYAELREVILSVNKERTLAYFEQMPEKSRVKLASAVRAWDESLTPSPSSSRLVELGFRAGQPSGELDRLIQIFVLSACEFKDISKSLRTSGVLFKSEDVERILRFRRPKWIMPLLERLADERAHINSFEYWTIYRKFVQEEIVRPSFEDSWIRIMFHSLADEANSKNIDYSIPTSKRKEFAKSLSGENSPLWKMVEADPALFEREVEAIFDLSSFPKEWTLTSIDHNDYWKELFLTMIKKKMIAKEKVVRHCFSALDRHFTDHQQRWFVQMLEYCMDNLPITDRELAQDSERFLSLLDKANPAARNLGFKILERLIKSGRISDTVVLKAIRPVLNDPSKTIAKKGLALVDRIAVQSREVGHDVTELLLQGLQHETTEIQDYSLKLLKKHKVLENPDARREILKTSDLLSPSVARNLKALLPDDDLTPQNIVAKLHIFVPTQTSACRYEKISPISAFDELLDSTVRLIESSGNADEIERFLDGMARLGCRKSTDFEHKTASLLFQIQKKLGNHSEIIDDKKMFNLMVPDPFQGCDIQTDIRYLAATWITGQLPVIQNSKMQVGNRFYVKCYRDSSGAEITRLFSTRMKYVARMLTSHKSFQLLSTPTCRDGWIDPIRFIERFIESEANNSGHDDHDRALALLRLTPEDREPALALLDKSIKRRSEYVNAVRYALGAKGVKIGKTPHYWIAAARCRDPLEDDPAVENTFPGYGPDAGMAARYKLDRELGRHDKIKIKVRISPKTKAKKIDLTLFPTVAVHVTEEMVYEESPGQYPWTLSVWPQNPDPAIAAALDTHSVYLDSPRKTDTGFRHALTLIGKPGTPIHAITASALFSGLAMKNPLLSTLATDVMIVAISDGRLSLDAAVKSARELCGLAILTEKNWLKPLKVIANESETHLVFVRDFLESVVDTVSKWEHAGFIELLYEYSVLTNKTISSKQCRKFLESITGMGKAAKVAKKLLNM